MFILAGAMLAACSSVPPIGSNEPPDALDRIRATDLSPRAPDQTGSVNTGTGGNQAQIYYGSSGTAVTVDVDGNGPRPAGGGTGDGVTLNFEDTPVSAVAKVILGDYLGAGYAIDPRVQGTISLSSGRPVPKSDLLYILESALRTSNAVLLHDAGGYRIVPADDAIGSGHVDRGDGGHNPEPGYGVSVVPLQHVSVGDNHKAPGQLCDEARVDPVGAFEKSHDRRRQWTRAPHGCRDDFEFRRGLDARPIGRNFSDP